MDFKFQKLILFPNKKHVFRTSLTFDEVYAILENNIDFVEDSVFKYGLFSKVRKQKFEGDLTKEYFRIQKNVNYRNALNPIISGYIEIEESKAVVYVEISIQIGVSLIFCILLFATILAMFKNIFFSFDINFFVTLIFSIIFLTFCMLNYKSECDIIIDDLKKIFEIEDE